MVSVVTLNKSDILEKWVGLIFSPPVIGPCFPFEVRTHVIQNYVYHTIILSGSLFTSGGEVNNKPLLYLASKELRTKTIKEL